MGSGACSVSFEDVLKTETLFFLGSEVFASHPILAQKVLRALEQKTKLIVADPIFTPLAQKAHLWLKIRPGTDVALLNGIAYVVLRDKLYDEYFIQNHLANFEQFQDYIFTQWKLENVERITGINKVLLEQVAYLFASSEKGLILWGLGLVQHKSGSYAAMAAANLASLCGFWGKAGCGAVPLRGHCNVQGVCDLGGLPYYWPGYQDFRQKQVQQKFAKLTKVKLPTQPGLDLSQMIQKGVKGELKALYLIGYNLAASHSQLKTVWQALNNVELVVVQDILENTSVDFADVVLPAACVFEKQGTFTSGERRIQLFEQAIPPPERAWPDWKILLKLAEKMGHKWNYTSPEDIAQEISQVWQAWNGVNYQRLRATGLQWPCPSLNHPGTPLLFAYGFPKTKIDLALPPYLAPLSKNLDNYPLLLITGKRLAHFRTGVKTLNSHYLRQVEPEPILEINPKDAKTYNLEDRTWVKLKNSQGELKVRLKWEKKVPPGYLFTDFHFPEAMVNVLIGKEEDVLVHTPEYKVIPVEIERI